MCLSRLEYLISCKLNFFTPLSLLDALAELSGFLHFYFCSFSLFLNYVRTSRIFLSLSGGNVILERDTQPQPQSVMQLIWREK